MANTFSLKPAATGVNTAAQFITTRLACHHFVVQASPNNTDAVWIGDHNVAVNGPGFQIATPVAGVILPGVSVPSVEGAPNQFDLSQWYYRSASSGQVINIIYIEG